MRLTMNKVILKMSLFLCVILSLGLRKTHAAEPFQFPSDAGMYNVKDYGATGNGATDDTRAITDAIMDDPVDFTRPKVLYFPEGTYLVSDRIFMFYVGNTNSCCLTIQGQGPEHSIIKLEDGCDGYTDGASKKPIFQTSSGNEAFRYSVFDITINTGSNNPGAVAINYVANNMGAIENVHIKSDNGQGHTGIDMTRAWPGPLLIKNVVIDGFDYGIHVKHAEYGPTFEYITLRNQNVAGIFNEGNTLPVRKLTSSNSVPAISQDGGMIILLESELDNGASSRSGVEINGGVLYARDVSSSGYGNTITCNGENVAGPVVEEYLSHQHRTLFNDPASSLKLPVQDAPPDFHDNDLRNWTNVNDYELVNAYGNTMPDIQAALYSGKSTVYLPTRRSVGYPIYWDLYIPPNVKAIIGFEALCGGGSENRPVRIYTEGDTDDPLYIIGPIDISVHEFVHSSSRPLVIKHAGIPVITNTAGAGPIFLEDVIAHVHITDGQWLWARQLNSESVANEGAGTLKISNDAGYLWILGIKTEGDGPVIRTSGSGSSEVLGSLLYPTSFFADDIWEQAAFINDESCHSFMLSHSNYSSERTTYKYIAEDTRENVTEKMTMDQFEGRFMPLFVGDKGCDVPTPPAAPSITYVPAPTRAQNEIMNPARSLSTPIRAMAGILPGPETRFKVSLPKNATGFEIFNARGQKLWRYTRTAATEKSTVLVPAGTSRGVAFIRMLWEQE
ncbi:MAG: hypothetical protein GF401_18770 [Chitinivibrionales bacterium]|nr:hypothetical protein [Chitinivibrionales bacterium]